MRFCPIPGCQSEIDGDQFLCGYHWMVGVADFDYVARKLQPVLHGEALDALKFMKKKPEKKSAPGRPEPRPTKPTAVPMHPLAGRSWTLEVLPSQLRGSETNPRKEFDQAALTELADSLKANGQLQAILVRPCPKWAAKRLKGFNAKTQRREGAKGATDQDFGLLQLMSGLVDTPLAIEFGGFSKEVLQQAGWEFFEKYHTDVEFEIVAGERRWRAAGAKYAGLKKVMVTVRCLSDDQVIEAQYVENLQRRDLTALEEAEGYDALIKAGKYTADSLAEKLGISRTVIFERRKLARLEGAAREALKEGKISATVAAVIAQFPGAELQKRALKECAFDWNGAPKPVRDVERSIEQGFMRALKSCGWDLEDALLVPASIGPACAKCPKMTRNMDDVNLAKGPARCMGLDCFEAKLKATKKRLEAEAAVKGLEFWDENRLSHNRYRSEYLVEGADEYLGSGKRVKVESIGKNVPHAIVATSGRGVLRVWKRADLEKAGALKVEKGETVEAKKADRKKELFEEKVFARMKELALVELEGRVVLPAVGEAVMREFVWECVLSWLDRDEEDDRVLNRGTIKFEELSREFCLKRMAMKIVEQWSAGMEEGEAPRLFDEARIDLVALRKKAAEELAPKAKKAGAKNGDVRLPGLGPGTLQPSLGALLDSVAKREAVPRRGRGTMKWRAIIEVEWEDKDGLKSADNLSEGFVLEKERLRLVDVRETSGVCRVCGCTEWEACEEGCSRVEADLCSACAPVRKKASWKGTKVRNKKPRPAR